MCEKNDGVVVWTLTAHIGSYILSAWFPGGTIIWEGLGSVAFLEEYIAESGFEILKAHTRPVCLCLSQII